jgi:RecB family exonuclease
VITPRRTTLFRVPDLTAYRATLARWIIELPFAAARDTCVVVPTRAAAEQLRRTVEDHALAETAAIVWPVVTTRHDLYLECAARLPAPVTLLSPFEREVIVSAVARDRAEDGLTPPFELRPGLIAEMLALYDQVRRLGRRVDDFERNLSDELEPARDSDRGAAQLLEQTRFLAATFRGYEERLADAGRCDEHGLRSTLLEQPAARPLARVVLTIADRLADPDGYWPADLDLLTRLPALASLDLLCTEATLGAGYLERLHAALPDLEEVQLTAAARPLPVLVMTPGAKPGDPPRAASLNRDREEELIAAARRIKRQQRDRTSVPLHRTALVVRRPLPYLYLARDVFADARIPFETLDTLPLAAEPFAAALDVVLDAVASDFTRTSLLALVRSPHFQFAGAEGPSEPVAAVPEAAIVACDVALADARYLGGLDRLEDIVARWQHVEAPASREERRQHAALTVLVPLLPALRLLAPLAQAGPIVEQIDRLLAWLDRHDSSRDPGTPDSSRRLRVRAAVRGALRALGDAYARHDAGARADVTTLTAATRRWLGAQTFATRTGEAGVQIVDAQAARYGEFDDLQIVGLIDGEWPERIRRNVLYPASLMALLEPLPAIADPTRRERDALVSARAAFRDLVWSPSRTVRLSTFALENDAVVEPSLLIDDVATWGLAAETEEPAVDRVSIAEALSLDPVAADAARGAALAWATARVGGPVPDRESFRGQAGAWHLPRVSVSRLERYLDCPFRFFSSEVLRLEEQPEDEDTRTPLERGRFLHELWETFFAEWQRRGRGRIRPEDVDDARALFETFCERALADLSPSEAVLERARLLGSALGPGIAHRVFAMEAERPHDVTERLIEFPLQGDFTFRSPDGRSRTVALSAKTDRIDVLAGGALRVIDYKSKKTPDLKQALQLPIYSFVALEALRMARGGQWSIGEALYLSFEGDKAVVPLRARGRTTDELIADAQERLLDALDDIARGVFPPRPAKRSLCGPCPYRAVCRLDIVEPEPEPDAVAETEAGRE